MSVSASGGSPSGICGFLAISAPSLECGQALLALALEDVAHEPVAALLGDLLDLAAELTVAGVAHEAAPALDGVAVGQRQLEPERLAEVEAVARRRSACRRR